MIHTSEKDRRYQEEAKLLRASSSDIKEPENLGTLIFLVNSKKDVSIKTVDFIAIPKNNSKENARNRALLALYLAKKNYEIVSASAEDILNNPEKYKNNASRESVVDALRNDNQIITPAQNSLPKSKSSCKIAILGILYESLDNLLKNGDMLTPSENMQAMILSKSISKLGNQIKSDEISLDNLIKVKSGLDSTLNQ